jgi:hypothetical protein
MQRKGIKTTADLRVFLADLLQKVEDDDIAPEKARELVKVAHAINESFNVELKMRLVAQKVGDFVPRVGMLEIGEPTAPALIDGTAREVA